MAFELYGMLAGNVSPTTGENVKPAYGGDEEAFLKKVVTPIYKVIEKVPPTPPKKVYLCFQLHQLMHSSLLHRKLKGVKVVKGAKGARQQNLSTHIGEIMMI